MRSDTHGPQMGVGIAASILLHGGLIAAFILLRSATPPPAPPVYRVQLFGAPQAPKAAVGVVKSDQTPVETKPLPPPPTPAASSPRAMPAPKPKESPTKAAVQPKATTPPSSSKPAPPSTPVPPAKTTGTPKAETPAAAPAAGSVEGGKGADVANIDTPGLEFPYPAYINNVARQVLLRFQSPSSRALSAEVRFIIRRDGSVDPESITLSKSSGNYAFNQAALGAVDAAANARAFGPLPTGFREDILPVTFRFNPSGIR